MPPPNVIQGFFLHRVSRQPQATPLPAHLPPLPPSAGNPLPPEVRQLMESFFRTSFADVRVHVDHRPHALGALAITQGSHIHFTAGHYDPATTRGRHILGHELAHVVQQRSGRVRNPFGAGVAVVHDPALEAEAERMATRAALVPVVAQRAVAQRAVAQRPMVQRPFVQRPVVQRPVVQRLVAQRPVVQRALGGLGAPVAPAPVLTAVHDAARDAEGYCGNFERVRSWQVANPVQGLIVQEIVRTFNVLHADDANDGQAIAGLALDGYVANPASSVHATILRYWEAWEVDALGNVSDGNEDTFGLCSIIAWDGTGVFAAAQHIRKTTRGNYQMTGTASFHPTAQPATHYGFAPNAVAVAGTLHARTTDPAAVLPAATAGPVVYTVTSTWNSRSPAGYYSRIT